MLRVLALSTVLLAVPVAAQDALSSHEEAALLVLELTDAREGFESGMNTMLDGMADPESPMMEIVVPSVREWADRYMTWDVMLPRYLDLFTEMYTEEELRAYGEWLQTEHGQRFASTQTELLERSMRMGQELAAEHEAELEAIIMERISELEGTPVPPPPMAEPKKGTR